MVNTMNNDSVQIATITSSDREEYIKMAEEFYAMPCCDHNVSASHFAAAFDYCLTPNPYAKIFMLRYDGRLAGYANIAFTYSIEAGGEVVLLEELFIKPEFRSHGIGKAFFDFVYQNFPAKRYRLEVTDCNKKAIKLYEKLGFTYLDYKQMIKEN